MSEVVENKKNNTKSPVNKTVVKKQTGEKNVDNSKEKKPKMQNESNIQNKAENNMTNKTTDRTTNRTMNRTMNTATNKTTNKVTNKNISKNTGKTTSTAKKEVIQYIPKKNNTINNDNKKEIINEKNNESTNKKNEKKFEYPELPNKKKKKGKSKIPYKRSATEEFDDETKYDTVSLVEIRKALENRVSPNQKKNLLKQILINIGIAIGMCLFFTIILFTYNRMEISILENLLKIITICLMICGVFILEKSYKKDNVALALKSIEIAFFAGLNLFLMYSTKINYNNINNLIIKIIIGIGIYYFIKLIILSIKSVKKYKKENSDIKDIIKK